MINVVRKKRKGNFLQTHLVDVKSCEELSEVGQADWLVVSRQRSDVNGGYKRHQPNERTCQRPKQPASEVGVGDLKGMKTSGAMILSYFCILVEKIDGQ